MLRLGISGARQPRRLTAATASVAAVCVLAALCLLAATPAAEAKGRWIIKGAGFGHGIGMSQYGAYGYAKQGTGYRMILKHYYTGTAIGLDPSKAVRVLLRPYQPRVRFKGASSACGVGLSEKKTYTAKRKGSKVILLNKRGTRLASCGGVLSATGGASVTLLGKGTYRGAIEARASVPGKLNAINAVNLEDYLKGVIAEESPSSWPLDALKAQAVAARSYALSTGVGGNGFDLYDDTRSQVYGGVGSETARTNQAMGRPPARSSSTTASLRRPTSSRPPVAIPRTTNTPFSAAPRCPTCAGYRTPTTAPRRITAGRESCPLPRCRLSWAGWCGAS